MISLAEDQKKIIIFKYGAAKNLAEVRKASAKQYYPKHPRMVPPRMTFKRAIDRFCQIASYKKQPPPGRPKMTGKTVASIEMLFEENERSSIREASKELGLSTGTVWSVLKTKLKWKVYRLPRAQCLTAAHVESRFLACRFWIQFPELWFENAIRTDEKMFVITSQPHRQNDRIWAPVPPNEVVEWNKTTAAKCMAWTSMADGRCHPVVWFQGSVTVRSTWTYLRTLSGLL